MRLGPAWLQSNPAISNSVNRLIRSPRYFEGRSNSLGFALMFSVIYCQLFRTRLFRVPRYFELIVLSLHLKSTPLFRTCQKQSTLSQLETYCNCSSGWNTHVLSCVARVSSRVIKDSPSFFFALVPTFSTNSRGNACYAGYSCMNSAVSILIIRHCKVMFWIFFGNLPC